MRDEPATFARRNKQTQRPQGWRWIVVEITNTEIASYMDVLICFLRPECLCVSQVCVEILFPLGLQRVVTLWGLGHGKQCSLLTLGHSKKLPFVTQKQSPQALLILNGHLPEVWRVNCCLPAIRSKVLRDSNSNILISITIACLLL